jgi:hypothetical protein
MMSDHAHILFPSDVPAPAPQQPPDWFSVRQSSAEARLAGIHGDGAAAKAPEGGKAGISASPTGPADKAKPDDVAATLFKDDAVSFDAKPVADIFDGFANSAISDNDGGERYRAVEAAKGGLIADAKAHGMDAKDLSEAMAVVKERQADGMFEPTPEQAEQRMAEGLAACRDEGMADADINLARRFVADLELIAPGTIDTLNRTGSGNDIRLIRKAIAEAKRRGYR